MVSDDTIVNCPEIPKCPDFPSDLLLKLSEEDRIIYLAGCALEAHISNHTKFDKGHYPYDQVGQYCAKWANATLYACGYGGSPQGGGGSTPTTPVPPSSPNSGESLGCGASASGSGSSCSGTCTATPSGGQSPYTYQWSSGETTKTINNKCSGSYNVSVKDSNGDIATASCSLT